jgi:hypothetical protein
LNTISQNDNFILCKAPAVFTPEILKKPEVQTAISLCVKCIGCELRLIYAPFFQSLEAQGILLKDQEDKSKYFLIKKLRVMSHLNHN